MRTQHWIAILVLMIMLVWNVNKAFAQFGQASLPAAMQNCRSLEAAGRWDEAGLAWYRLVMEMVAGPPGVGSMQMPLAFRQNVMRRAIACYTRAANGGDDTSGGESDGKQMLLGMYQQMTRLEPDNPTWDLLLAQAECARGGYVEAKTYLENSVQRTGGDPRVRARAQLLLSHVATFQAADWQRIAAEDAATAEKRRRFQKVPKLVHFNGYDFWIIDLN